MGERSKHYKQAKHLRESHPRGRGSEVGEVGEVEGDESNLQCR